MKLKRTEDYDIEAGEDYKVEGDRIRGLKRLEETRTMRLEGSI